MTEIETTYLVKNNDVASYPDLQVRLALRTILYNAHPELDLDEVLSILKSEVIYLETRMDKGVYIDDEAR